MGVYGSVWECMGGGSRRHAQCCVWAAMLSYFLILSHTFPYFPIKKAAINHIARVCGEKKSRSKKCSGF